MTTTVYATGYFRAFAWVLALLLLTTAGAHAASHWEQRVRTMIVNRVHEVDPSAQVEIGSLRELRLVPPCPVAARLRFSGSGTDRDVLVSCPDKGWQVNVTFRLVHRVLALVATHDLSVGTRLVNGDMAVRYVESGYSRETVSRPGVFVGRQLATSVSAGQIITLHDVQLMPWVHAGQDITIIVKAGPVTVRVPAVAMQGGSAGQSILVRNPTTGRIFRVEITRHGIYDSSFG